MGNAIVLDLALPSSGDGGGSGKVTAIQVPIRAVRFYYIPCPEFFFLMIARHIAQNQGSF